MNIEVFVEGFDEILVEDIITMKLTIERTNLPEGQEIGVSHSNDFPELYHEKVALLITQSERIVYEAIVEIDQRKTVQEFKHCPREVKFFLFFRLVFTNSKLKFTL